MKKKFTWNSVSSISYFLTKKNIYFLKFLILKKLKKTRFFSFFEPFFSKIVKKWKNGHFEIPRPFFHRQFFHDFQKFQPGKVQKKAEKKSKITKLVVKKWKKWHFWHFFTFLQADSYLIFLQKSQKKANTPCIGVQGFWPKKTHFLLKNVYERRLIFKNAQKCQKVTLFWLFQKSHFLTPFFGPIFSPDLLRTISNLLKKCPTKSAFKLQKVIKIR